MTSINHRLFGSVAGRHELRRGAAPDHPHGVRRLMRLTNVFSKQEGGEPKAAMLHFTHYNFERNHRTIRCTPATEPASRPMP